MESAQQITSLLADWSNGDRAALDQLMPLVYDELRQIAHRHLNREREGHTLQTTALVNEVYLKLINEREMRWQDRAHFFAVAAQLMRNILVDYARTRNYAKRGGGVQPVLLDEALTIAEERADELVALDDALQALEAFDQRKSRIAVLRFFAGLSVEETAEVLAVAPVTVMRDWRLAKAWLHRELSR
jgi:RNA polymerase sigma factor (TIGR02999 family)